MLFLKALSSGPNHLPKSPHPNIWLKLSLNLCFWEGKKYSVGIIKEKLFHIHGSFKNNFTLFTSPEGWENKTHGLYVLIMYVCMYESLSRQTLLKGRKILISLTECK